MQKLQTQYINVAASIIADISSGIYRTPANALKEIISNSFDGCASEVYVNTGYSNFDIFTISDNGVGMSVEDFIYYMNHIGGSVKRLQGYASLCNRPLIGKLGIGILAVSQICKEFTVISSKGSGKKFEALIDLSEFEEIEARKKQLGSGVSSKVEIGRYEPVLYDEEAGKTYTIIVLNKIDEGYRGSLKKDLDIPRFNQRVANPQGFREFVKDVASAKRGLSQFTEYDRLLWELAIASPIQYFDDGPILGQNCITDLKEKLRKYNFRVIVDGIELRKPVLFPLDKKVKIKGTDFDFVQFQFDNLKFSHYKGPQLKFKGYIYFQRKAIIPPELRGILIRIRNVGIGGYDKSLLHYPMPTGVLASQVSGEIYVEEGLESALNIDRNSFRETDLNYLELQRTIFKALAGSKEEPGMGFTPVFDSIRANSKKRRESELAQKEKEYLGYLTKMLNQVLNKNISINVLDRDSGRPLEIFDDNVLLYNRNNLWPKRHREKNIYRKILILMEVAEKNSESPEAAHALFLQLLNRARK